MLRPTNFKMKTILALFALLFASTAFAETPPIAPPPQPAQVNEVDYKQAFLKLVYDKSVLYSGKVEDATSKAIDYAAAEAKPMMEEYIKYEIIDHICDALPTFIFWCGSISILLFIVWRANVNDEWTEGKIVCAVCACFAILIGTFGVFTGAPDSPRRHNTSVFEDVKLAVQAGVSPRIYIAKQLGTYISNLRK
jgi:hypothetical protein